jgi:hypothetical protein
VPFALFISLAANEQTLPGTAGGLPYGGAAPGVHLKGEEMVLLDTAQTMASELMASASVAPV